MHMCRWHKQHAAWMDGSWTHLDAEAVERDVQNTFKTMAKLSKVFAARDLPACAENCATLREDVAAFKPYAPLVAALRCPGMRGRHWDALSDSLGIDMHLADSFALSQAQVCCLPIFAWVASWCFWIACQVTCESCTARGTARASRVLLQASRPMTLSELLSAAATFA